MAFQFPTGRSYTYSVSLGIENFKFVDCYCEALEICKHGKKMNVLIQQFLVFQGDHQFCVKSTKNSVDVCDVLYVL